MNKLIIPVIFFSLGAAIGYLASSSNDYPHNDHPNNESTNNFFDISNNENRALIKELEEKNIALQMEIDILKRSQTTTSTLTAIDRQNNQSLKNHETQQEKLTEAGNSNQENIKELQQEIAMRDARQFTDSVLSNITKNNYQNFSLNVTSQFQNQPIDTEWAEAEESKINNIFIERAELSTVALINTECKTSQCKVSFAASDTEQSSEIARQLTDILTESNGSSFYTLVHNHENSTTDIYISNSADVFAID